MSTKLYKPELATGSDGGGDTNGIVEGETEGFVDLLTALATVEQVGLEVLDDRDEDTASAVGDDSAVRAGRTADKRACWKGKNKSITSMLRSSSMKSWWRTVGNLESRENRDEEGCEGHFLGRRGVEG